MFYYTFSYLDKTENTISAEDIRNLDFRKSTDQIRSGRVPMVASVSEAFCELFEDTWVSNPMFSVLLREVEHLDYIGDRKFRSTMNGDILGIDCLSHGVMNLVLAEQFPGFVVRFDSLGNNLYKYMVQFYSQMNIILIGTMNPYTAGVGSDTWIPKIFILDTNDYVGCESEFAASFKSWLNMEGNSHYYLPASQFGVKLVTPLNLSWSGDAKRDFSFSLDLRYNVNLIEGTSGSGKSLFVRELNKLSRYGNMERLLSNNTEISHEYCKDYKLFVAKGMIQLYGLSQSERFVVVVDMDSDIQSIKDVLEFVKESNWIWIIIGHNLTQRVKISFDAIQKVKILYVEHELVFMPYLPINNSLVFDTILTEDTGSGPALFSVLGVDVMGCGGKDGVYKRCLESLQEGKSVLVVMDYNTVEPYLLKLVYMQCEFKGHLSIITPTSSEYCILASMGKLNAYNKMFDSISKMSDESLSKLLKPISHKVVTMEHIDLIIMAYLLDETNVAVLKSYDYVKVLGIRSSNILDVISSESKWVTGKLVDADKVDAIKDSLSRDKNGDNVFRDLSVKTDLFSE